MFQSLPSSGSNWIGARVSFQMKPYAIDNCSRAEYNAIPAINQSALKHFKDSPFHFRHAATAPRKPPTPAMVLGCLVEHLLLGVAFDFVAKEYTDYKTKEAQQWRDATLAKGIAIVDDAMMEKAKAMVARVQSKSAYKALFPGRGNVALVGTHEPTGLSIKALLDWIPDNELLLADLKTSEDASLWGFGKKVADFGYSIQAAWYTDLFNQVYNEQRDFGDIVVESDPPHAVSFQMFRPSDCALARIQIDKWMETYKTCLDTDTWPEYPDDWQWATPPAWLFKDV